MWLVLLHLQCHTGDSTLRFGRGWLHSSDAQAERAPRICPTLGLTRGLSSTAHEPLLWAASIKARGHPATALLQGGKRGLRAARCAQSEGNNFVNPSVGVQKTELGFLCWMSLTVYLVVWLWDWGLWDFNILPSTLTYPWAVKKPRSPMGFTEHLVSGANDPSTHVIKHIQSIT